MSIKNPFPCDANTTLREIAKQWGVSTETIRNVETSALLGFHAGCLKDPVLRPLVAGDRGEVMKCMDQWCLLTDGASPNATE